MTTVPTVCYIGGFCLTTEHQLFLTRDYYRLAYFIFLVSSKWVLWNSMTSNVEMTKHILDVLKSNSITIM